MDQGRRHGGPVSALDRAEVSVLIARPVRDLAVAMAKIRGVPLEHLVTQALEAYLDASGSRGPAGLEGRLDAALDELADLRERLSRVESVGRRR